MKTQYWVYYYFGTGHYENAWLIMKFCDKYFHAGETSHFFLQTTYLILSLKHANESDRWSQHTFKKFLLKTLLSYGPSN